MAQGKLVDYASSVTVLGVKPPFANPPCG